MCIYFSFSCPIEPAVRRKRLNLLYELQFEMNRVADISKLAA